VSEKPTRQSNTRQTRILWTDYAAFVCVLGSALTGLALWLFLDKGPEGAKTLLGWRRHDWSDLHLYFSLAFVGLLVLHFVQHWRWIRTVAPRQAVAGGRLRGLARGAAITVLALAVVFALYYAFRAEAGSYGGGGWSRRGQGGAQMEQAPGDAPAPGRGAGGGGGFGGRGQAKRKEAASALTPADSGSAGGSSAYGAAPSGSCPT